MNSRHKRLHTSLLSKVIRIAGTSDSSAVAPAQLLLAPCRQNLKSATGQLLRCFSNDGICWRVLTAELVRASPATSHLGELKADARPQPEHRALRHDPHRPLAGGAGGERLPRAPAG